MGLLASLLVLSAGHAGDNNQGNNNNGGGQPNNNQGQEAGADRALRLLTLAPIPSAGADNNTAGGMYSFDISYVDRPYATKPTISLTGPIKVCRLSTQ